MARFSPRGRSGVSRPRKLDRRVCRALARRVRVRREDFARLAIWCCRPNGPTSVFRRSKPSRTWSESTAAANWVNSRQANRMRRCGRDRIAAGLYPAADPERATPNACYGKASASRALVSRASHRERLELPTDRSGAVGRVGCSLRRMDPLSGWQESHSAHLARSFRISLDRYPNKLPWISSCSRDQTFWKSRPGPTQKILRHWNDWWRRESGSVDLGGTRSVPSWTTRRSSLHFLTWLELRDTKRNWSRGTTFRRDAEHFFARNRLASRT